MTKTTKRPTKLPHGDGSLRWRPDRGLWVGVLAMGYGPDGKRLRREVTGKSKTAVLEKMKAIRAELEKGVIPAPARLTVGEYLETWLASIQQSEAIKPATVDCYRAHVTRYLTPALGQIALAKLQPQHVERLLAEMQARGLSANTRRLTRSTLRRALGVAERQGYLSRNVAALAQGPKVEHTAALVTLTAEQCADLIGAAHGTWLEVFVLFGLTLGLRPGEIHGLRWEDIDLEARTVTITGTLYRLKGKGLVRSTPKTPQSRRQLHLSDSLVAALEAQAARQDAAEQSCVGAGAENVVSMLRSKRGTARTGYVLTTSIGTPIDPANAWDAFRGLVTDTLGEDVRITAHGQRHTAATLAITSGAPLKYVSDLLGHSSIGVTSSVYVHLRPAELVDTALLLERTVLEARKATGTDGVGTVAR